MTATKSFCSCLLFVFVLYFSFKVQHPLAVGQREKLSKLKKISIAVVLIWTFTLFISLSRVCCTGTGTGCWFLRPHLKCDLFIYSSFLSWKRLASAAFWAGALFFVLAGSSSSHAERPQPFLSVQSRSHSVPLMEQSTTGGDYSLLLVHFNSPTAPCYYFRKTHTFAHTHT